MGIVTFAIPLASRARCNYWNFAMDNLFATINSMIRQTKKSYNVILARTKGDGALPDFCHQDRIIIVDVDDCNNWSTDKDNKTLEMLKVHYALKNKFFLRTDWDDVYNVNLVDWVEKNENEDGFMITKGYFYKPKKHAVKTLDNFNMQCGSCHLINYSEDELLNGVHHPKKETFHHQYVHKYRAAIGRPLTNIPFRAGLYVITGKNLSTEKHRRILKKVTWLPVTKEIEKAFALGEVNG